MKFGPVVVLSAVLSSMPVPARADGVPLVEAARRGDIAAVHALLRRGIDVNSATPDGTTALHWAARTGEVKLVGVLLARGARVDAQNRYGMSPLRVASVRGNTAVVEALLKAGADPNGVREESGDTPLMIAARSGHADLVRLLLAHGAQADRVEPVRQQTALMWAAAEKHPRVVELLLAAGANPTRLSSMKLSPLMFAIRAGDLESTRLLLDAGVDVNAPAADGTRMLQFAILNARFDIAAYLLERGADVTLADPHGTPLQLLSFIRRSAQATQAIIPRQLPQVGIDAFELAKALLKHGDSINARYQFPGPPPHVPFGGYWLQFTGATPFWVAAITADVPWMRFLAANGADPSIPTATKITPLLAAAGIGVMAGVSAGTNAEALEAVQLAAELGNDPEYVIRGGDRPDRLWEGATAMHGAAMRNADNIVIWLAARGVGLDVKNTRGVSPYQIAAHNGAALLIGNGPNGMAYIAAPDVAARLLALATEMGQTLDTTPPIVLPPMAAR